MADEILSVNETVQLFISSPANVAHESDDAGDATVLGKRLVMTSVCYAAVQYKWTGLDAANGSITVESSVTGEDGSYVQKASATATLPAGSGTDIFSFNGGVVTEKFYRVIWTPGANTTGTLDAWIFGKIPA